MPLQSVCARKFIILTLQANQHDYEIPPHVLNTTSQTLSLLQWQDSDEQHRDDSTLHTELE